MNCLPKHLEPALGYLSLGMHQDAWDELESLPPELRADDKYRLIETPSAGYPQRTEWNVRGPSRCWRARCSLSNTAASLERSSKKIQQCVI